MPPKVNPTNLDFGTLLREGPDGHIGPKTMQVVIANPNNEPVSWGVTVTGALFSLDKNQVNIAPNGNQTVKVTLKQVILKPGTYNATLQVDPKGWNTTCPIKVTVQ